MLISLQLLCDNYLWYEIYHITIISAIIWAAQMSLQNNLFLMILFYLILIAVCSLQNVYQVKPITVSQKTYDALIKNSTIQVILYHPSFSWAI